MRTRTLRLQAVRYTTERAIRRERLHLTEGSFSVDLFSFYYYCPTFRLITTMSVSLQSGIITFQLFLRFFNTRALGDNLFAITSSIIVTFL